MRKLILTLAAIMAAGPVVGPTIGAEPPLPPTAAEKREAAVWESIGDCIARRDQLLTKFAYVSHGRGASIDAGEENPHLARISIRIVDQSRGYDLQASYQIIEPPAGVPTLTNGGTAYLKDGTTHRKALSDPSYGKWEFTKPTGEPLSVWKKKMPSVVRMICSGSDPFDDWLVPDSYDHTDDYGIIEKWVMGKYKLTGTEYRGAGITAAQFEHELIRGKWRGKYEIDIEFSQAHEGLPIKVHSLDTLDPHSHAFIQIDWRKHRGQLLPYRIEHSLGYTAMNIGGPAIAEQIARCYWLVGDEIDPILAADIPVEALLDHHGIAHSVELQTAFGPERVPFLHEYPKDLERQK